MALLRKLLFIYIFILLTFSYAYAGISVTDVVVEGDVASVTINDTIIIKEIKIVEKDGNKSLRFPEYVNKNSRAYAQVEVLGKKFLGDITAAVLLNKTSETNESLDFSIDNIFFLKDSSRRANAYVSFNDTVKVTCGIMETKGDLWIAWPARKEKDSWIDQVVFVDKKFKKKVEAEVIRLYKEAQSEESDEVTGRR
ncbi:MAG: hypothetical protein ABH868_06510 [bacterium]